MVDIKSGSEGYEKFYKSSDWNYNFFYIKIYLHSFLNILHLFRPKSQFKNILDVGCGTGIYSYMFSKLGFQTLGIDYASSAIEKAKLKYPGIAFLQQDARNITLEAKFDMFFCKGLSIFNSLDYKDVNQVLTSWENNLTEKGLIVILSKTDFTQKSPTGWIFHTEDEIMKLFSHPAYSIQLNYIHSKLQYLFLLPFPRKLLLKMVNSISKSIIKTLRRPVNYMVVLTKNEF